MSDSYIASIQRVEDYIERHLSEPLNLEMLARVAHFSPYHFHRIFRVFTGETLNKFVARRRVERAASQLYTLPDKSITEIALDCGFSGAAAFARSFKAHFKMTASQWRDAYLEDVEDSLRKISQTNRKNRQSMGKIWKDAQVTRLYGGGTNQWSVTMKKQNLTTDITVETLDEMTVAYVRHVGPYKGDSELFGKLFGRLAQWAGPRGIFALPTMQMLSVYHDDPEVTEEEKLRMSVCVAVPADTQTSGEIGLMTVAGGEYAVARFEMLPKDYEAAWGLVYGGWFPESGYQPDDRPPLEMYDNDPSTHPEGKHIVRICVPVKPR